MPGADEVGNRRERDKLTIAEVCADLGISRRTFYEWRAKNRALKCITLPNCSLRIRQSEYPAVARLARGSRLMDDDTTYDIRVYRTEVYKGAKVTSYRVR
jgi:predicted DNA-binding transcriptional regulator AlpA